MWRNDEYSHNGVVGASGLLFNEAAEKKRLEDCMDLWSRSSRSDSTGDRCGIVLLNYKNAGYCCNVLFEKCAKNGGNGHENLIKIWMKGTGESKLNCALIYGYSIQGGKLRMNSCTFNGNDMPDRMEKVFPEVFRKIRDG